MCETSLIAVEIELGLLLKAYFKTLKSKKRRRAFLKTLKRDAKKHAKDTRKIGGDAHEAAEIAVPRILSHIGELQSLLA